MIELGRLGCNPRKSGKGQTNASLIMLEGEPTLGLPRSHGGRTRCTWGRWQVPLKLWWWMPECPWLGNAQAGMKGPRRPVSFLLVPFIPFWRAGNLGKTRSPKVWIISGPVDDVCGRVTLLAKIYLSFVSPFVLSFIFSLWIMPQPTNCRAGSVAVSTNQAWDEWKSGGVKKSTHWEPRAQWML